MVEFKVLTYISANQQMGWCLKAPTTHRWALHWGTYFSQWRGTNLPTTHRRNFIHRISHFAFATMVLGNVCALCLVTGRQVAARICDVYSAVTDGKVDLQAECMVWGAPEKGHSRSGRPGVGAGTVRQRTGGVRPGPVR